MAHGLPAPEKKRLKFRVSAPAGTPAAATPEGGEVAPIQLTVELLCHTVLINGGATPGAQLELCFSVSEVLRELCKQLWHAQLSSSAKASPESCCWYPSHILSAADKSASLCRGEN